MDSNGQGNMHINKRKIFLVDDVNYYLVSIKERLKKKYEIFTIQTSETLFELLENVIPEIILLDIAMPDINGFDILEKLKEEKLYADIPVIFLTATKDTDSMIKAMKMGAVDFMLKPFTDEELIEAVEFQLVPQAKMKNKPIILAIDDDPSILTSAKHVLSDLYTVYTLPKAESCREILKVVVPDLFLLDLQMPSVSGFELIPIIREHREHHYTPIVFLTSEGSREAVSQAIFVGAVDYITKPIDDSILRGKMAVHTKDYVIRRRIRELIKL
jgi:PleD family two-component response regulator